LNLYQTITFIHKKLMEEILFKFFSHYINVDQSFVNTSHTNTMKGLE